MRPRRRGPPVLLQQRERSSCSGSFVGHSLLIVVECPGDPLPARVAQVLHTLHTLSTKAHASRAVNASGTRHCSCTHSAHTNQLLLQQLTFFLMLLALAVIPARARVTAIDRDAHYPEGPLWRAGKLLYVEYSDGNLKSRDGQVPGNDAAGGVLWHQDGCGPSGLIERGGLLLVACSAGAYQAAN